MVHAYRETTSPARGARILPHPPSHLVFAGALPEASGGAGIPGSRRPEGRRAGTGPTAVVPASPPPREPSSRRRDRWLATLALLPLLACGSRGGDYAAPLDSEGPFAGAGEVVALNTTDGALLAVDPAAEAVRALPVAPGGRHLTLTPDGLTALVVTGNTLAAPALAALSLSPDSLGTEVDTPLPANPDVVHVGPDGRFVLLTVDPSETQAGPGQAVVNPNQAVIVDRAAGTAAAVALGTDSPAPRAVVFAEPGQGGTQLCAVLFDKAIAILDLGAPTNVVRVPVRIQGGPDVTPLMALFSSFVSGQGYLYVMAAQTDDVIAIALSTTGGLAASINFLAGGQGLTDIALPSGPPPPATVLALYGQKALQLDATGRVDLTVSATLAAPATQLAPAAANLLYAFSTEGGDELSVWDPAHGQAAGATLDGPVQALVVSPAGDFAVAAIASSPPELAVLSAALGAGGPALSVSPLVVAGPPVGMEFDAAGDCYFAQAGTPFVTRVDPRSLATQSVTLDSDATGLLLLPAAAIALQSSPFGQLTVVPTGSFDRADSRVFPDYLLTREVSLVSGP